MATGESGHPLTSSRPLFVTANAGHVNCINIANVVLYALSTGVLVLAFFNRLPFGDTNPRDILFMKYPTLITPAEEALFLFPVMVLFNGVFVFFQLLPVYRNDKMVTIITPLWIAANFLLVSWLRELTFDIPGSLAYAMILSLAILGCFFGMILVLDSHKPTFFQYWCLRACFSVNAGWWIYAVAVNVNMWAVSVGLDESTKMAIAMVSLSWIFVLTALFGVNTRRPDPLLVIPVAYCLFHVWRSNFLTKDLLKMPEDMIHSMQLATQHVYWGVVALGVMSSFGRMAMCCASNKTLEKMDEGGMEEAGKSVFM